MSRPVPRTRALVTIASLLAALAAAPVAGAQDCAAPASAKGKPAKPFKARFEFREALRGVDCAVPGVPYALPRYELEGSGNGTHLGRFGVSSSNCSLPLSPSGQQVRFFGQTVTIVAADGSRILAEYDGVGTALYSTPGAGAYRLDGTYRITGGTGRFAGVAGCGRLSGMQSVTGSTLPPDGGFGQIELDGVIAY